MAKTRIITVMFPDNTQATRQTARIYTHAVRSQGDKNNYTISWCGRFDLMIKTKRKYKNPEVGIIVNDPWIEYPEKAPASFKAYELPNSGGSF